MVVNVNEMVINSNKRVRIKDCNEVEERVTIGRIKSGKYKVVKKQKVDVK